MIETLPIRPGKNAARWALVLALALTYLADKESAAMSQVRPAPASSHSSNLVDAFTTTAGWNPGTAPGAVARIDAAPGLHGKSMRLAYDFRGSQAYVLASKEFALTLPQHFEFSFFIKRTKPDNSFEFKLIDPDGNTFMKKWYSLGSVGHWQEVVIRREDIAWAWGPSSNAKLHTIAKIEFVVTGGGKGEVCFDHLALTSLRAPVDDAHQRKPSHPLCPRWLSEEQAYWTMVGVPGDDNEALIAEDGTIEPHKRGFSILPLLALDGSLVTRNDAHITQSLEQDVLPIPSVHWLHAGAALDIQLFAHGKPGSSVAYARYTISNRRTHQLSGTLKLLVQPYQVYPPWQGGGGFSPIREIRHAKGIVHVNGRPRIYLPIEADDFQTGSENLEHGAAAKQRGAHRWIPFKSAALKDPSGFASGCIEFDFDLEPGATADYYLLLPLHDTVPDIKPESDHALVAETWDLRLRETIALWSDVVKGISIQGPEQAVLDTLKANVAYNLVTQDGPALQPGSRSYDKAWMRDGSIAAYALLQAGRPEDARNFIEWFATFQAGNGLVPPIIDTKAEDPLWEEKQNGLVEYDSQGEFVWIIDQYFRFTGDHAFLERMFEPAVQSLRFLQQLRAQRLTPEFRDGPAEKRVFYGLLPESTSHEGYHMKHSYWDDFWALKGWDSARSMALELGRTDLLEWMDEEAANFKTCVYDSIALEFELKGIDYIPGCAELGDIDPTSTAAALVYCDQLDAMPAKQLRRTFDRFCEEFRRRMKPGATYRLTPYETRSVPALVRMGRKDDALDLLRFLLDCRRPKAWNHLAEVVHSDERFPCYVGDMPHTWVGAEYVIAVRSLFAYEGKGALVIGAGIDPKWLENGNPVGVTDLPVHGGLLSYAMKHEGDTVRVELSGSAHPTGGLILKSPLSRTIKEVRINGTAADVTASGDIQIQTLPAAVTIVY